MMVLDKVYLGDDERTFPIFLSVVVSYPVSDDDPSRPFACRHHPCPLPL